VPLTIPSHPGLVAPLVVVDRGRLDGVALFVGAVAPDLPYAWSRANLPVEFDGHFTPPVFLFSAPIAVVVALLFRRYVARPLAAHLPDAAPFRLRDVAYAANDRYRWWWSYLCGALGAISHLVTDSFTHPEPWAARLVDGRLYSRVDLPLLGTNRVYDVIYAVLNVVGGLLLVGSMAFAGWRRARRGVPHPGLPEATARSSVALLAPLAAALIVGAVLADRTWGPETFPKASMQFVGMTAIGLLAGCAWAGRELGLRPGDTVERVGAPAG
jgi:Domain of unknown function (DUF4184)